ncbi:MAG: hypothetical protein ACREJM_07365 [Candidatus Saccharimonadales bacterium]
MRNVMTLVVVWLIMVIVAAILQLLLKRVGYVISIFTDILAAAALTWTLIASVRGQSVSIEEAFSKGVSYWLKMIGVAVLLWLSVAGSLLLLIVPFFFVFPRLILAYYFLVDKNMGVMDAYKASWNATKGNVGKVWGIVGVNILIVLLMVTIIGIPFSIYFLIMYSAAIALLYETLSKNQPQAAPATPAQPTAPAAPAATPPAAPPTA